MTFPIIDGYRTVEFGNVGESRTKLLNFIFNGNKRATAGVLKEDYLDENEPIEQVGEIMVVVGNENEPVGKIQITRVDIVPFGEVPDEFALAEAEGDVSGDDFRESHSKFWTANSYEITLETPIVLAYFEVL